MACIGRPSDLTSKLGIEICSRLIEVGSLRKVCLADDMPGKTTIFTWLSKGDTLEASEENNVYIDFRNQYARARRLAKEYRFDEHWEDIEETALVPLVVDGQVALDDDGNARTTVTPQSVAMARLKHDAFKWQASKEDPKKYGEKVQQEISGPDGGAIKTEQAIDASKLSTELLKELMDARKPDTD